MDNNKLSLRRRPWNGPAKSFAWLALLIDHVTARTFPERPKLT